MVSAANGSPSLTPAAVLPASFSTNSSRTRSSTSSRSPAVQLWPAHRKQAVIAASAAASTSAPSSTTSGPLPPISSSSALPAARSAIRRPVAVEPMKPTAAVAGCDTSSSPTTGPGPSTKLNTPGGRSASATHSANSPEQTVVLGAGVHTTELPVASAGATISAGIVYGQFHGVTTATTPSGRRTSSTRAPGVELLGIDPRAGSRPRPPPPHRDQLVDLVVGLAAAACPGPACTRAPAPRGGVRTRRRRGAAPRRGRTRSPPPSPG